MHLTDSFVESSTAKTSFKNVCFSNFNNYTVPVISFSSHQCSLYNKFAYVFRSQKISFHVIESFVNDNIEYESFANRGEVWRSDGPYK